MDKNDQPICEIDRCGTKRWFLSNQRHREDGPAVEFTDGSKAWFLHGRRNRIDGPAVEYYDGYKKWFYHGKLIDCDSQEEFERVIKLQVLW